MLGCFGSELEHVVEGDHGFGAPPDAECFDEPGELRLGECAAEGFDGEGVPAVAPPRSGWSTFCDALLGDATWT